MQSTQTGFVSRIEWRWVTIISLLFVLVAFLPYLLLTFTPARDINWAFMGALHDYPDAAAYLSKMQQGQDGSFLMQFRHTPDPHAGVLIYPVYPLLGQLAQIILLSPVIVFHVARIIAAFFMYVALYHLAAHIWVKVRTRRFFFIIAAVGTGLGWLISPLVGGATTLDLIVPQAFPFYGAAINVHFPLTIATLALMLSVLIPAFRPGFNVRPAVDNGGVIIILTSIALAFLYPETLLPLWLALLGCVGAQWFIKRNKTPYELGWTLWVIIPALPIAVYYLIVFQNNEVFAQWAWQKATIPPTPIFFIVGLGLPFIIALPNLVRAVRRFEPDGDRLMLLWLVFMVVIAYLPMPLASDTLIGLMLPIAYFAARALEDFWLTRIQLPRRQLYRVYAVAVPILALSNLYALFLPVAPLFSGWIPGGMALEPEYVRAFQYLATQTNSNDVILAAPNVSIWIPYWTGARTYYGHPDETLNADERRQFVQQWYGGQASLCDDIAGMRMIQQGMLPVRYVVYGVREQALGNRTCLRNLPLEAVFGNVEVYAVPSGTLNQP